MTAAVIDGKAFAAKLRSMTASTALGVLSASVNTRPSMSFVRITWK